MQVDVDRPVEEKNHIKKKAACSINRINTRWTEVLRPEGCVILSEKGKLKTTTEVTVHTKTSKKSLNHWLRLEKLN